MPPALERRQDRGRFDTARVFQETGWVIARDGWALAGLCVALSVAPLAIAYGLPALDASGSARLAHWRVSLVDLVGRFALLAVLGGLVTRLALSRLEGSDTRPATFVRAIATSFPLVFGVMVAGYWSYFPAVIPSAAGTTAMLGRSQAVGAAVMTLIPISLFLGVLTPVLVAEAPSWAEALARSARLMAAGRWLLLAVWLTSVATSLLIADVLPRAALAWFPRSALQASATSRVFFVALTQLPASLLGVALTVFVAAYYRGLCRARDGLPPSDIARVFD